MDIRNLSEPCCDAEHRNNAGNHKYK
jgi:hypothetical protein